MKKQADAYLIEKLSSSKSSDRQEVMIYLYEHMYEQVERYVQKNSGESADVEDVFQDSLVALYKHARAGRFDSQMRLEAYFFTICKNLWLKELKKKGKNVELTEKHAQQLELETQESIMVTVERTKLLDQLISALGVDCYKLLKFFYYEKRRMIEIASLLSLTNAQAAKDKKASCMKKLRARVLDSPHVLEMLK